MSHQSSAHKGLRFFLIFLCLGKTFENAESNNALESRLGWSTSSQTYRHFGRIDGEPMESEWNIFPGFNMLQLSEGVKRLLLRLGETPEKFTSRCSMTFPVGKTMKKHDWQMLDLYLCMQKDLVQDHGHSLVLVVRKVVLYK